MGVHGNAIILCTTPRTLFLLLCVYPSFNNCESLERGGEVGGSKTPSLRHQRVQDTRGTRRTLFQASLITVITHHVSSFPLLPSLGCLPRAHIKAT